MDKYIAERELLYSLKGGSAKDKFVVRIGVPYLVKEGMVNFNFDPGTAGCTVEFDGLPENIVEDVYGADTVQALNLASNIDGYLKGLSKKYDIYYLDGEPYFD